MKFAISPTEAPLAPVVAVVESSAKQIMSEILRSVTSSEEQDVAIDENPACCAVERKPCISVKAVDSAHRRVLSLILLPFSSAEQESRLGDDEFPQKNATGWSGHDVELDPGAVAAVSSASRMLSLIVLLFSSAEQESRVGDDEFPEKNGT